MVRNTIKKVSEHFCPLESHKKVTPLIGSRRDSQLLTLIRLIAVPQKEEISISVESNWPLVVLGEIYQFLLRSRNVFLFGYPNSI